MRIDVTFTPGELKAYLANSDRNHRRLIVIIDVLRATTTIITALKNKAIWVLPVLAPEEAFEMKKVYGDAILAGERDGEKIDGFDLGNSPFEFTEEVVAGRGIIQSTTNGTVNIRYAMGYGEVIICSFININAVRRFCLDYNADILVACSGRYNIMCLEDAVCAGILVEGIIEQSDCYRYEMDSVIISMHLYDECRNEILGMLKKSQHGRYLTSLGYGRDLEFSAKVDSTDIVPYIADDRVVIGLQ
ncbi:MAG: hypothetical protein B6D57_04470 [Candidatus Coatesbacteria bacterium 4484_99]|uniref:Probable 2-phosphosulfolactate phosphatase n=1 Tax=Candidatus Coatesbacteria bacterium 4484_99 TaxID=1970774 RepID=A0A1W9S075_9BACT|nr:MAG: hypothetical protein B6D57_04470 [Candidatus Coatesbacteria bacterium 4484_99]RLC43892.1 MAG: 2-phosphosulfolactate phosphatase [Candidatus Coatesbacteria bacterium]